MTVHRAFAVAFLVSLATCFTATGAEKLGPAQLVSDARDAIADAARLFRDGKLAVKEAAFHPLLLSLRRASSTLSRLDKLREARSTAFFVSLSDARSAVSGVALSFRKAGARNPRLEDALERLAGSMYHLHRSYAWEELRKRRGGNLSEGERSELRTMNERRSAAISKLGILRDKLRGVDKGHKIARGLNELIALSRGVLVERPNLAAWVSFRISLDPLFGRWEAMSYYSDRGLKLDWTFIDSDLRALKGLYHASLRAVQVDNWAFFDRQIDRPDGYVSPPAPLAEEDRAALLQYLSNLDFGKEGEEAFALYGAWDREGAEEPSYADEGEEDEGEEYRYDGRDDEETTFTDDEESSWEAEVPSGDGLESVGDGSSDAESDDTEGSALVPPIPLDEPPGDREW